MTCEKRTAFQQEALPLHIEQAPLSLAVSLLAERRYLQLRSVLQLSLQDLPRPLSHHSLLSFASLTSLADNGQIDVRILCP